MSGGALLSRHAENLYWMARYIERAENLARVLDVTQTFSRDSRGAQNWLSVVQINADTERFEQLYPVVTAQAVKQFYLLDAANPTSLLRVVQAARENARALRPLISTEMWLHLNVFHNRLRSLRPEDLTDSALPQICDEIKMACQTHTGITEGTFYRDQGWYFYQLGRHLERADQGTRLLDIKYHLLLPSAADVGSPLDVSQWNSVLRAAAAYHAFRRVYPRGMTPRTVAGFLLLNDSYPRSVILCVRAVEHFLTLLRSRHQLRGGVEALAALDELRAALADRSIDRVIGEGLHDFLDWTQRRLIDIGDELAASFFRPGLR